MKRTPRTIRLLAALLAAVVTLAQSTPAWADVIKEEPVAVEETTEQVEEASPSEEETLAEKSDSAETVEDEADLPEADETEAPEEATEDSDSETERLHRHDDPHGGGYLPMPGESEAPVVDQDLDYQSMKDALNDSREDREYLNATQEAMGASAASRAFPYSYDREEDILTYLKKYYPDTRDQDWTGTCWAHSALAMSEFYMISHGMAEKDVDFSERHLSYWAYTQGKPSLAGDTGDTIYYNGVTGSFGSQPSIYGVGGNSYMAALTLMQRRGVASENNYPFSDIEYDDRLDPDSEHDNVAYLKNAYMISRNNTKLAKETLLKNGLLGVSYHDYNEYFNYDTSAYYCPFVFNTTHAVAVVGWDDDYPRENFDSSDWWYGKYHMKPANDGAWLIRNSWTTETGIDYDSYFWMSYEDKSMSDFWVYEMIDPADPDFDNNYFYDSQIHLCDRTNAVKSANIYQANSEDTSSKETLQAVYFDLSYITGSNIGYTIEIYKNVDPAKGPESGDKAEEATTTGTIALSGMYTIPLKEPVELNYGESFSVVITLSDKKSVNYECGGLAWTGLEQSVGAQDKQSFLYDGRKWVDFGKKGNGDRKYPSGNLGIHALTADGGLDGRIKLTMQGEDEPVSALMFGEESQVGSWKQLSAKAYDAANEEDFEATNCMIWHSDDRDVATVEEGVVTAVANGETTITAYYGGRKATCKVTVALTEYTVKLNANGGYFLRNAENGGTVSLTEDEIKVCKNGTFTIEDPQRSNSVFNGWLDEGGTEFNLGETIDGNMTLYADWSAQYRVEAPSASIDSGSNVTPGEKIELSVDTKDAQIFYTTNGTTPTKDSTLYTEPIPVTGVDGDTFTIMAYAVKTDYTDSSVEMFDYTVTRDPDAEWGDICNADKAQIGFDGECPAFIPHDIWVADASYDSEVVYTGANVTPEPRVYHGNKLLVKGTDYTLSYKNNKNVSTGLPDSKRPTITVNGKGNYSGQEKVLFDIVKASLKHEKDTGHIQVSPIRELATGKAIKPVPVVYYNGIVLKNNTDFTVSYPSTEDGAYVNSGTYDITLTGKGNFCTDADEAITVDLTIVAKDKATSIAKATLKNFQSSVLMSSDPVPAKGGYTQDEEKLEVWLTRTGPKLVKDVNYTIEYRNNAQAGTATMIITGTGDYTGSLSKTFKVAQAPIKNATISDYDDAVEWDADATENGAYFQEPEVYYDGKELEEGTDYYLTYKNNTKAGKATMTVNGMGRFNGSVSKQFTITGHNIVSNRITINVTNVSSSKWSWNGAEYTYYGYSFANNDDFYANYVSTGAIPTLTILYDDVELREGIDYTLSYKNHKKYDYRKKPEVTITGKGGFTGKITAKYDMTYSHYLNNATVSAPDLVRSKKKNGLFSTPTVTLNGAKLKAGTDYDKTIKYEYERDVILDNGSIRRAGTPVSPNDILQEGTTALIRVTVYDYYPYSNTSVSTLYTVKAGDLSKAKVTINGGKAFDYAGKAVYPTKADIVVKIGQTTLEPSDYEIVGYEDACKVGTAKIKLRGIGNYCGEKTEKYKIGQKKLLFTWFAPIILEP
ncbi:MAG: chitobiase/beta-hexosaminidase C-terminal domain-containing protein [Lachnospiraceae bacterium]|nr:chitobiase/beta-hexosaminidase C-terminal domain-containing protein [Lachnospiraceae bacterium]